MNLHASVANKRLTCKLSPLDATLAKNRGHPSTFRRLGVPTRQPLFFQTFTDSLTGTGEAHLLFFNHLHTLFVATEGYVPGCPPKLPARRCANVRPILSPYLITSSVSPSVPLRPNALGATIGKVARILHDPGKQLRSPRCLRLRERTSGTVQHRSRSQTPVRSELQVVPRSSVLNLDRSAGWLASCIRQGCW